MKADDLLANAPPAPIMPVKKESRDESCERPTKYTNGKDVITKIKKDIKDEPLEEDYFMDTDDLPCKLDR